MKYEDEFFHGYPTAILTEDRMKELEKSIDYIKERIRSASEHTTPGSVVDTIGIPHMYQTLQKRTDELEICKLYLSQKK